MSVIGYKGLSKLVKEASTIMAYFAENPRDGFQLCLIVKAPIKANGKKVGDHETFHTINFHKPIVENPPVLRLHHSYAQGSAIQVLLANEISRASKDKRVPYMHAKPAMWGTGTRPATFKVESGPNHHTGGQIERELNGNVHVLSFGYDYGCHVYLADFDISPISDKTYRGFEWKTDGDSDDVRYSYRTYTFDREFDSVDTRPHDNY